MDEFVELALQRTIFAPETSVKIRSLLLDRRHIGRVNPPLRVKG